MSKDEQFVIDDLSTKYLSHSQEIERQFMRAFLRGGMTDSTKVILSYQIDELKKIVDDMPSPKKQR